MNRLSTPAVALVLIVAITTLSACAGNQADTEVTGSSGSVSAPGASEAKNAPDDASWPPAPVADPEPISIVIPVDWPEADKENAREWVTVQQSTRQCQLRRGIDSYRYLPVWEETYDDSGALASSGPPPSDWDAHFQRPFQFFRTSAVVCFNQALEQIGRQPNGPLEFPARLPRFEESDFSDASTLDIPSEWSDADRTSARQGWEVELQVRACMAAAGYPSYGEPPYWLMTDSYRAQDPWMSTFPLAKQPDVRLALSGDYENTPYDWQKGGCVGAARHDVEGI